jgi:hypothetical protein
MSDLWKFWHDIIAPNLGKMEPEQAAEFVREFVRHLTSPRPNGANARTSDAPQLDPQAFRQRLDEVHAKMTVEKLKKMSLEDVAAVVWEYNDVLGQRPKDDNELAVDRLSEFVERLIGRQGSIEPDYDALYNKKAELDRKFFGRET